MYERDNDPALPGKNGKLECRTGVGFLPTSGSRSQKLNLECQTISMYCEPVGFLGTSIP